MERIQRPGTRALNKPVLILGVTPGLAGAAFSITAVIAGLADGTPGRIGAAIVFVAIWAFGRRISRTDPNYLQILTKSFRSKALYDPLKVNTHG